MDIAALRAMLVRFATVHGSPEAEDVAHDVIAGALAAGGLDRPVSYWYVATRNRCRTLRRRYERQCPMAVEMAAPHLVLGGALLPDTQEAQWLLRYYERPRRWGRQRTSRDKVRAFRYRQRLRAQLLQKDGV